MTNPHGDLEDRLRRVLARAAEDVDDGPRVWAGPRRSSRRRPRLLPAAGSVVALGSVAIAILVVALALSAGSGHQTSTSSSSPASSSTASSSQSSSVQAVRVTPAGVERALLGMPSSPRPTAASCRAPTAGETAQASISGVGSVFFSCRITRGGQRARFYVQVILSTGSFIAEQEHDHQDQIFGCCVARTSR